MTSLKGISTAQAASRGKRSFYVPEVLSRALPGELWGAFNVVSGIAKSYVSQATQFRPQKVTTQATAAADFPLSGSGGNESDVTGDAATLRQRLDYRPKLSLFDVAICGTAPAAICSVLYLAIKPAKLSVPYAIGMCMIYAAWVAICRAFLLERHYTVRLVQARELGDRDSKFTDLDGVSVHYKTHSPASPRAAVHCYHGFGANTGSWDPIQARLSSMGALVTSHDMPGFGLTGRPSDMKKYTLAFNGRLGRKVQDMELAALTSNKENLQGNNVAQEQPAAPKRVARVLMGHSLGAACATAEILKSQIKDIDALILVAPAVIAFGFTAPSGGGKVGQVGRHGNSSEASFARKRVKVDLQVQAEARKSRQKNLPFRLAVALTQALLAVTSGFWTRLLEPFTVLGLRSAVRSRKFWERGLGRAWFHKDKVPSQTVDAYRKPQLVKGWEKGLVRFTAARLAGGRSIPAILRDAWKGKVEPTQAEELAQLVEEHNIKVLIIHGKYDALVPASNSRRLASLLPSAELKIMDRTGHVPHEERPDEFLAIVKNFLEKI